MAAAIHEPIPRPLALAILQAKARMIKNGIRPTVLELRGADFPRLAEFNGCTHALGLHVRFTDGPATVLGVRKHPLFEAVATEREVVITPAGDEPVDLSARFRAVLEQMIKDLQPEVDGIRARGRDRRPSRWRGGALVVDAQEYATAFKRNCSRVALTRAEFDELRRLFSVAIGAAIDKTRAPAAATSAYDRFANSSTARADMEDEGFDPS